MSTRRVKTLDYNDDDLEYDEDDYDDGEGQDEVSPEDRESLRLGTIEVKKMLGPAYQISDTEIQDALWNFYYDTTKTVNLLKGNSQSMQQP